MRLVVLGDPVKHSLSPPLHTAAMRSAGISGDYGRRRVDRAGMRAAVADLRAGILTGANVTMPHKRLAHDLADELSPEAAASGAVNTLVAEAGRVHGHNTDVPAIQAAWRDSGLPIDTPIMILGTGGAAAAALVALGDADVTVVGRRTGAADDLIARTGLHARTGRWLEARSGAVVVNATPIGMEGDHLPPGVVDSAAGLFDMAYGAAPTPAVRRAAQLGIPYVSGTGMLIAQASVSFQLWTGMEADVVAMRAALEAALAAESNGGNPN